MNTYTYMDRQMGRDMDSNTARSMDINVNRDIDTNLNIQNRIESWINIYIYVKELI